MSNPLDGLNLRDLYYLLDNDQRNEVMGNEANKLLKEIVDGPIFNEWIMLKEKEDKEKKEQEEFLNFMEKGFGIKRDPKLSLRENCTRVATILEIHSLGKRGNNRDHK